MQDDVGWATRWQPWAACALAVSLIAQASGVGAMCVASLVLLLADLTPKEVQRMHKAEGLAYGQIVRRVLGRVRVRSRRRRLPRRAVQAAWILVRVAAGPGGGRRAPWAGLTKEEARRRRNPTQLGPWE